MALPKRRHSSSRGGMRRAHDFLVSKGVSRCQRCGQTKLPHRVCGNCGHYGDKEVISFEE